MTQKPSDVLPPPDIGGGDEEPETLYTQVGRALSMWEGIENQTAGIFAILTGDPKHLPSSPATRAYGTIATFRGRREMVLAAAEAFFAGSNEKGLLAEIKSFLNACSDYSARRNEIAHGTVTKLAMSDNTYPEANLDDPTWYLVPPHYNSNKRSLIPPNTHLVAKPGQSEKARVIEFLREMLRKGLGKYKYNSKQVAHYADGFQGLGKRGEDLVRRLGEFVEKQRQASQQTSPEQ